MSQNDFVPSFEIPQAYLLSRRHVFVGGFWRRLRAWVRVGVSFLKIIFGVAVGLRSERNQKLTVAIYDRCYSISNQEWKNENKDKRIKLHFGDEILRVNGFFLQSIHQQLVSSAISNYGAQSVLEVGCGRGNNLAFLAKVHAKVNFTGLELSARGVANAGKFFEEEGIRNARCVVGDACSLPFPDKSFDMVFTILVLEQMPRLFGTALSEMRRVARGHCVFIEPFAETNSFSARLNLFYRDYFRASFRSFEKFGHSPLVFFSSYPQKQKFSTGFLVTAPSN